MPRLTPTSPSSHLFILFSTLSLHSVWHKARQAERERRAGINVGPSRRQTCSHMNRRDRSARSLSLSLARPPARSARLLGFCGGRLFLNYYRRQMLVSRCSLSRLERFSAASSLLRASAAPPLSSFSRLCLLSWCRSFTVSLGS